MNVEKLDFKKTLSKYETCFSPVFKDLSTIILQNINLPDNSNFKKKYIFTRIDLCIFRNTSKIIILNYFLRIHHI